MTANTNTRPHFGRFTIERTYRHSPERVFSAFENKDAHYCRSISGEGWDSGGYHHDFRVGGHEHSKFRPEGPADWFGNETCFLEIVEAQRIVSASSTTMDDKPFSHSLATTGLATDGQGGCRLTYTEQAVYQGGNVELTCRKLGCEEVYDKPAFELDTHA